MKRIWVSLEMKLANKSKCKWKTKLKIEKKNVSSFSEQVAFLIAWAAVWVLAHVFCTLNNKIKTVLINSL